MGIPAVKRINRGEYIKKYVKNLTIEKFGFLTLLHIPHC